MEHNAAWEAIPRTLIWFKDCTTPLTGEDFEIGATRVIGGEIGSYRETGASDDSRFGYRFDVKRTDRPHLMEIVFPDDRERIMSICDGVCYDLTCGITVGGDQGNTHTMRRAYNIFWPRAYDQSILICSLDKDKPAAAASITVYELEALPAAALAEETYPTRTFGIQYEDPCNIGASEGTRSTQEWAAHHIEYMRMTGQNRLVYPINWYFGPNIPVRSQTASRGNSVVLAENGDRAFYARNVTGEFPDWLDEILTQFDAEGWQFTGSMTLMRLGRLAVLMNTDEASVRRGADTVCNILYDGSIQISTNDWTADYGYYSSPERREWGKLQAPIFNPLHPTVREQVKEYLREVAQRYAHHPSFKGISINFWHGTMLWFGNLLTGYDDICADRFTRDTGIVIPAEAGDPHRFEKRYAFLMEHAKEAWIAWRCAVVREFLCELRDMLRMIRPDYCLGVNVWNEPACGGYWHGREGIPLHSCADAQYGIGPSHEELYRYAGMDFVLYEGEEGISFAVERDLRDKTQWNTTDPLLFRTLTDAAWLEQDLFRHLRRLSSSEGFHFNCWVERWGNHISEPLGDGDRADLETILSLPDYRATDVHRENCIYADDPDHTFFYSSELRITALLPDAPYFMEQLTADLALHDALSVTAGGLYLDKAHAMEQLAFAREYRRLPAKRFSDVEGITDPVCLRYLCEDGYTWVYALNREPYRVGVSFTCGADTESFVLDAFALKTIRYEGTAVPDAVSVLLPEEIRQQYLQDAEEAVKRLSLCRDAGTEIGCCADRISAQIRKAAAHGHVSELRHLLQSYAVKMAYRYQK